MEVIVIVVVAHVKYTLSFVVVLMMAVMQWK
jgi:hypothetical protein